jgi:ataxin-10
MYEADTLRLLNLLLPRIQFGKPVPSPMAKGVGAETLLDPTAFPYVKRDLLRLLGTLSYGNRLGQDRMRACGGIEIVMNHCVVDELNPCESSPPVHDV